MGAGTASGRRWRGRREHGARNHVPRENHQRAEEHRHSRKRIEENRNVNSTAECLGHLLCFFFFKKKRKLSGTFTAPFLRKGYKFSWVRSSDGAHHCCRCSCSANSGAWRITITVSVLPQLAYTASRDSPIQLFLTEPALCGRRDGGRSCFCTDYSQHHLHKIHGVLDVVCSPKNRSKKKKKDAPSWPAAPHVSSLFASHICFFPPQARLLSVLLMSWKKEIRRENHK